MSTHYSLAQKTARLKAWANRKAQNILAISKDRKQTPVLCYTGMSGIAHATALSLALHDLGVKLDMVYVRKAGEKSHGDKIERTSIRSKSFVIFVDDFVCSGKTFRRVKKAMIDECGMSIAYLAVFDKFDSNNITSLPAI